MPSSRTLTRTRRAARIIVIAVAVLVVALSILFVAGHGAVNACESYALRRTDELGAGGWETKRSVSWWPPGVRCRFRFSNGAEETIREESVVVPWAS